MSSYPVKLVAVSGREQAVVLKVTRNGLCLYTEHGKEIQQLPYQHIVKWLPSKMRSRDPGPDECLDIQVETASGKKDLRMRCQSAPAVQTIIADIRQTVQAIMTEISDPAKASKSSPLKAGLAASAAAAAKGAPASPANDPAHSFDVFTRHVSEGMPTGAMASPAGSDRMPAAATAADAADAAVRAVAACAAGLSERVSSLPAAAEPAYEGSRAGASSDLMSPAKQQQQQQQQNSGSLRRSLSNMFRLSQQKQQQQQQEEQEQEQQQQRYSSQQQQKDQEFSGSGAFASPLHQSFSRNKPLAQPLSVAGAVRALSGAGAQQHAVDTQDLEQDSTGRIAIGKLGSGAPLRRSTGELAEFTGEAAAQIAFLEDMVNRLSHELSARLGEDDAAGLRLSTSLGDSSKGGPLPPWMKDSRYLNPLLSAYDQRLGDAQVEVAAKANAVRDIKARVRQLVEENEALHDQLAEQAARMEGRSLLDSYADSSMERARMQERLELLEHENDLLVHQQGELEVEIGRLNAQLAERDQQLAAVSDVAAAGSSRIMDLEDDLQRAKRANSDMPSLRDKIKELSDRLKEESARTAEAIGAADAARQQQNAVQAELAAAQAQARMVPGLQADLSKARSAAESSAAQVAALRAEADGLRGALHAVESRLVEYQEKDTEVYLRIKEAMELAEEARLERDAARTETDSLQTQLAATQARLQEATRQLSGGGDGAPSYKELKQKLAAAEDRLQEALRSDEEQSAKLSELRLTVERLNRDKSSLKAELAGLKEELELCSFATSKTPDVAERLAELERSRDEAVQKLDSQKRAATRAEREWELERQQMQGDIQRWVKRVAAAEEAAATAATASVEAQQAAAAAESELSSFKAARARVDSELRQQLVDLREERDAEVAALVQKLERALATCDKSVVDAEQMLQAKDSLLRRWKQEAQLIASKLEVALQQHQAELAERQAQVATLTHENMQLSQQLAVAQEQQDMLEQELDATRMTCQEAELLLGEAESRAAAANASAAAQQDDIMHELHTLQSQLERSQIDKVRAERQRDGVAAKLGRMIMVTGSPSSSPTPGGRQSVDAPATGPPAPSSVFGSPPRSPSGRGESYSARGEGKASSSAAGAAAAASSPRSRGSLSRSADRDREGRLVGMAGAFLVAAGRASPSAGLKLRPLNVSAAGPEQSLKDQEP